MVISLWDHQRELYDAVRLEMARGYKRILVRAETGFGKTRLAGAMIEAALSKGLKAGFVVPRKELRRQTSESFTDLGISHSSIASGMHYNPFADAYICTAGTLHTKLDRLEPSIVFIDEAHFGNAQIGKIIDYYADKGCWIIGLTATPKKMDGTPLAQWFDVMVQGKSMRWLIDHGYLSDYRLFQPSMPDLSGVKFDKSRGDYNGAQLKKKMEQDRKIIGDAVKHYRDLAMGRLNMAFTTSIKHSNILAESFRNAGIMAVHMDGDTKEADRRKIARAFAKREILVLCTVDLCLFGYDLASAAGMPATVECLSDLRPTGSLPLQMQKWGRGLRKKDDDCIILDHAGNSFHKNGERNHGFPCDEREWSLLGETINHTGEKGVATKQCEKCFFVYAPAPACPNCGHVNATQEREVTMEDGTLQEIKRDSRREQDDVYNYYYKKAVEQGFKNPSLFAKNAVLAKKKGSL